MPNIEAGNVFYKSMTYIAQAKTAGIICGARAPIILPSRADSDETKFLSIALALYIS
jgi:phosphate butyryltransferase